MKLGIIGLPQSGKTTLFNAVSGQQEAVGDFSRTVHRAVIRVPDKRLDDLATLYKPGKVTHTEIEFLDAAGFSGRGKKSDVGEITPELRLMDAIVLVVDCFSEGCNPEGDVHTIIDEMILADLMVTENNVDKLARTVQLTGKKDRVKELEILKRCHDTLNEEKTLSEIDLSDEEIKEIRGYAFLTLKPFLLVFNIPEARLSEAEMIYAGYEKHCRKGTRDISVICGKIEMEIAALPEEEQGEFLKELGIERPATATLIRKSHHLLGLISFLRITEP
jgi:ribosome-binding ATPase YchF (GTP1/OBG family)